MKNRVPIRENIFREDEGVAKLLAVQCTSCGQIFFPKVNFCFSCLKKEMKEFVLGPYGKLYSYTIGRLPAARFSPPYFVGMVDMPEGVRIFGPLKIKEGQDVKIGMDMEVVIEELWEEEDKHIIGYKFKPIQGLNY